MSMNEITVSVRKIKNFKDAIALSNETVTQDLSESNVVQTFHDFPSANHGGLDLISQLQNNLEQLEDLQQRVSFVTREIQSLIR